MNFISLLNSVGQNWGNVWRSDIAKAIKKWLRARLRPLLVIAFVSFVYMTGWLLALLTIMAWVVLIASSCIACWLITKAMQAQHNLRDVPYLPSVLVVALISFSLLLTIKVATKVVAEQPTGQKTTMPVVAENAARPSIPQNESQQPAISSTANPQSVRSITQQVDDALKGKRQIDAEAVDAIRPDLSPEEAKAFAREAMVVLYAMNLLEESNEVHEHAGATVMASFILNNQVKFNLDVFEVKQVVDQNIASFERFRQNYARVEKEILMPTDRLFSALFSGSLAPRNLDASAKVMQNAILSSASSMDGVFNELFLDLTNLSRLIEGTQHFKNFRMEQRQKALDKARERNETPANLRRMAEVDLPGL